MPSSGTLEIKFTPTEGNGEPMVFKIYDFLGGGVAMGMYNTDEVSMHFLVLPIYSLCSRHHCIFYSRGHKLYARGHSVARRKTAPCGGLPK